MVLLRHLSCLCGLWLSDSGYFVELSTARSSSYSSAGKIFVLDKAMTGLPRQTRAGRVSICYYIVATVR